MLWLCWGIRENEICRIARVKLFDCIVEVGGGTSVVLLLRRDEEMEVMVMMVVLVDVVIVEVG